MTFSIVGHCDRTGMFGVAITTSSICVGARCPWARAGVGAVATQNITDPGLGNVLLDRLDSGADAPSALASVVMERTDIEYRQLTIVDRGGRTAVYSGSETLGQHEVAEGVHCAAGGNLLSNTDVPAAMTRTFAQQRDHHLPERLLRSLEGGLAAGGEAGPVRSAALLVVYQHPWPLVDLRVDWDDDDPLLRLRRLWQDYEPQMVDYVVRAVDPASAPSYGVPGDP